MTGCYMREWTGETIGELLVRTGTARREEKDKRGWSKLDIRSCLSNKASHLERNTHTVLKVDRFSCLPLQLPQNLTSSKQESLAPVLTYRTESNIPQRHLPEKRKPLLLRPLHTCAQRHHPHVHQGWDKGAVRFRDDDFGNY